MNWTHIPEHLNPVAFSIGPVSIHWYGLMYVAAFLAVYLLVSFRIRDERLPYSQNTIGDFMVWVIAGVLIGGRLGYVVFYDLGHYLRHPIEIISPFEFSNGIRFTGIYGMSYHGGLLGALGAFLLFSRRHRIPFWRLTDLFIPAIPLGYTFGRIGNFINGELYGRVTTVPWGMVFPMDPARSLRHPSQLYEAFFEGIFLFLILWGLRKRRHFDGFLFSVYLIGYGAVRFFIEFAREPDSHLGFVAGSLTMGQVLCALMVLAGMTVYLLRRSSKSR